MDANFDVDDFGRVESGIVPTFADQELSPSSSEIEAELACFKAGQRLEMDGDLFSWWNENIGRLPELSKLARMVHSIPATSVSSERLFSKAGLICANSLRNRLSGQIVRQILIVKANLDALLLAPANELESDDESEEKCDF
ncbi:hypothetical protein niasHT_022861 [Heterodera trifolii]|uniref:HAT C-terminal dimerisation domain-containing protein n=1 Tax=Heterodera trifolii TaxID=157864 RepID=A0ABD2KN57_9BILA